MGRPSTLIIILLGNSAQTTPDSWLPPWGGGGATVGCWNCASARTFWNSNFHGFITKRITAAETSYTQLHTRVARASKEMKLLPMKHYCNSCNIVKDKLKQSVEFWKAVNAGNLI